MEGHRALLPELDPISIAKNKWTRYWSTMQNKRRRSTGSGVSMYNKKMRGVDLLGSLVTVHRVSILRKKWYFPFYTWSLSVATVNAWRLKEFVMKAINPEYQQEPYISFLRELFQSMLETHSSRPRHTNIAKKVYRIKTLWKGALSSRYRVCWWIENQTGC